MSINNKDIWREEKKYCIICDKECCTSDIKIMNSFICEECLQKMLVTNIDSQQYDLIKDRIKDSIVKEIYERED